MRVRLWLLGTELFDLVLGELPTQDPEREVRAVDGTHHHVGFQPRGLDTDMPEER